MALCSVLPENTDRIRKSREINCNFYFLVIYIVITACLIYNSNGGVFRIRRRWFDTGVSMCERGCKYA